MSRVVRLTVGPIVGHTTTTTARIWGRGAIPVSGGRCTGVLEIAPADKSARPRRFTCEFDDHYDYTGIIDVDGLMPETRYVVRFGAVDNVDDIVVGALSLDAIAASAFRTMKPASASSTSFLLGSCRLPITGKAGDKIFASAARVLETAPVDFLMLAGDQVYCDFVDSAGHFLDAYQKAFTFPAQRALMARLPTYMILNDHEITNNWHQGRMDPWDEQGRERPAAVVVADRNRFVRAIRAYHSYQHIHGPGFKRGQTPTSLWYKFQSGPADVFVADLRTERHYDQRRQIMSDTQFDELLAFLGENPGRPKIIVSTVMLFPALHGHGKDAWQWFTRQRNILLDKIADTPSLNVLFLQGDVRSSMAAELELGGGRSAYSVTASPWSWPVTNCAGAFVFGAALDGSRPSDWRVNRRGEKVHTVESFARVEVSAADVRVQFYGRDGTALEREPLLLPFHP